MSQEKTYPAELTVGRNIVEATFAMCLWKNPDLYNDYEKINENGDQTLITQDGKFYFSLGKQIWKQGYKSIDHVTVETYLKGKPALRKSFEGKGGMRMVDDMRSTVTPENIDASYDSLVKLNYLMWLHDQGFNLTPHINRFLNMPSHEIYDFYERAFNDGSLATGHDINIKPLKIDDAYIDKCIKGNVRGIAYGKVCNILNYLTLGLPKGDLYMLAGYSGVGKSSFVFENYILPISCKGIKCAIISNEMKEESFQDLLMIHILTQDLGYWGLNRKLLKQGELNDENIEMLNRAKQISVEKYGNIKFSKLFDNDFRKIRKITRQLARDGFEVIFYDTMKSEDNANDIMWQQLLIQSRKLFQLASKENISIIASYQLALHTLNKRYLDASCLSNAKQIKEVFSEMVYLRPLWDDEYTGEKNDVKPYVLQHDESGKYGKVEISFALEPDKKYVVAFLDKTRNDKDGQTIIYEFDGQFNKWKEIGYCTVRQDRG